MRSKEVLEHPFLKEKQFSPSKFVPALVFSVSLAVLGITQQLWKSEKEEIMKDSSISFLLRQKEVQKEVEERMKNYGYTLR